jgi:hypothetical protein
MKKASGLKILLLLSIIINLCLVYLFRLEIIASLKSYKNNDFKPIDTRVFYYSFDSFEEVSLKLKGNSCGELNDSLIVKPNIYKIGNSCVNLGKEGLYRILNSDGSIKHVIVFQSDLYQLLSSISWIVTHGNEHNKLDFNEKQAQATKGKLFLTCSRVVGFAGLILERYKIKSRVIQTFASKDLNGYDDEHVLLEVFDPKIQKWILIDIDNNVWFSQNKVGLSLVEFKSALDSSKNIKLEKLSNDATIDISNFRQNGKNFYGLISENVIGNENLIRWHKYVMDIVTIDKFFYNEQQIDFMGKKEPEYKFKNRNDFIKEFYENSTSN